MKGNAIIITILVAIVVGGAGFFGGMQYQKSKTPSFGGQAGARGQFAGRAGAGAGRNGMGATVGQIISSDDKSITVQLQDGSSKIVLLSGSTMINKAATGTKADLQNGTRVAVFGTTNSDGSVTASNVQINPMMRPNGSGVPQGSAQPQ